MGSMVPSADIASLTQLRTDGSSRDVIQLSPGRDVHIGRRARRLDFSLRPLDERAARDCALRGRGLRWLVDDHSRNGVAIAARGAWRGNTARASWSATSCCGLNCQGRQSCEICPVCSTEYPDDVKFCPMTGRRCDPPRRRATSWVRSRGSLTTS